MCMCVLVDPPNYKIGTPQWQTHLGLTQTVMVPDYCPLYFLFVPFLSSGASQVVVILDTLSQYYNINIY